MKCNNNYDCDNCEFDCYGQEESFERIKTKVKKHDKAKKKNTRRIKNDFNEDSF